ncbi:MAG: NADPH:quinone oxidoreductase family protein [Anaerolineae bacterium]
MRALLCRQWGEPETLTLEDVPAPQVSAGKVRVRVRACGVNYADTLMIAGKYQVKPPLPFSPGFEIAGEVLEVGEGVRHVQPGDKVIALSDYGGCAEEAVVPAGMVMARPSMMDDVQAAAFPVAYGTSHVGLARRAHLQVGETLLVFGAAGGVGLTAVELGKLMGATVIACASSPEKLQVAAQYGADHLIDYSKENVRERVKELTDGKGADVIYDPVGGALFDEAMRCIAWEGRLLVIGFAGGTIPQLPVNLALVKNCAVVGVYWGAYGARKPEVLINSLVTLMGWYTQGKLKPHISQTYPLDKAADAMRALLERRSTGKVVITTD